MSVTRSVESRRGSWTSALLLVAGLLLVIWCGSRRSRMDVSHFLLLILGGATIVWSWREGGFR
ncbi:MAG: hypothetical protein NT069_29620, partial [Planctomycetota bacterium]|nr:hypothetical protein [Planctomycetota bacterium]